MRQLTVILNEASYLGRFAKPLLSAWGTGQTILQGLVEAFSPQGISLSNVRIEDGSRSLGEQAIVIQFGNWANYRFRMERVELNLVNFSEEQLSQASQILVAGERWIKTMTEQVSFESHQLTYVGHLSIEGMTSTELLVQLPHFKLSGVGSDLGAGCVLHWYDPDRGWNGTLMLDHSQVIPDGLFAMFSVITKSQSLDYPSAIIESRRYFTDLLGQFELKLDAG